MMKRVILLILLFSALLSGCKTTIQKEETAVAEPTDELIIYIPPYSDYWLNPIISRFEFLYGIEVTTVDFSDSVETYRDTISAELMSGEGTDIIFPAAMSMNIQKAMENEVFMDLQPYLDQDTTFNKKDYLIETFETGKLDDKQYVVPFAYSFYQYISSEVKLKDLGFDWNDAQDITSFLEQISELIPEAQKNATFKQMMSSQNFWCFFFEQSGIEFINYDTNEICKDEELIKEFFEAYKKYFYLDYNSDGIIYSDGIGYKHMLCDEFYFDDAFALRNIISLASYLKTYGGYEMSSLKGMDGNTRAFIQMSAAVRANSKNKLNAYNFIRLLLSEETQAGNLVGMPIHKESLEKKVYEEHSIYTTGKLSEGYTATQLEKKEVNAIIDILYSADLYCYSDDYVTEMIFETMLPYFQDKQDYDTCFNDLKSKLSLYLYE